MSPELYVSGALRHLGVVVTWRPFMRFTPCGYSEVLTSAHKLGVI
jgi:hypothetical protein